MWIVDWFRHTFRRALERTAPPPPSPAEITAAERQRRHRMRNELNAGRMHLKELEHRAESVRRRYALMVTGAQVENEQRLE